MKTRSTFIALLLVACAHDRTYSRGAPGGAPISVPVRGPSIGPLGPLRDPGSREYPPTTHKLPLPAPGIWADEPRGALDVPDVSVLGVRPGFADAAAFPDQNVLDAFVQCAQEINAHVERVDRRTRESLLSGSTRQRECAVAVFVNACMADWESRWRTQAPPWWASRPAEQEALQRARVRRQFRLCGDSADLPVGANEILYRVVKATGQRAPLRRPPALPTPARQPPRAAAAPAGQLLGMSLPALPGVPASEDVARECATEMSQRLSHLHHLEQAMFRSLVQGAGRDPRQQQCLALHLYALCLAERMGAASAGETGFRRGMTLLELVEAGLPPGSWDTSALVGALTRELNARCDRGAYSREVQAVVEWVRERGPELGTLH